jgi:hypothetical protein
MIGLGVIILRDTLEYEITHYHVTLFLLKTVKEASKDVMKSMARCLDLCTGDVVGRMEVVCSVASCVEKLLAARARGI